MRVVPVMPFTMYLYTPERDGNSLLRTEFLGVCWIGRCKLVGIKSPARRISLKQGLVTPGYPAGSLEFTPLVRCKLVECCALQT